MSTTLAFGQSAQHTLLPPSLLPPLAPLTRPAHPSPLLYRPPPAGSSHRDPPFTLVVTVMGAQHLPGRGGADGGGAPSPYCSLGLYGDASDRLKAATRALADNGFNPVWSEQFRFHVGHPDVAVLHIAIHDSAPPLELGRPRSLLAYAAVPVPAIRLGYRSLPLRGPGGKKIPLCSVLCRFQRR